MRQVLILQCNSEPLPVRRLYNGCPVPSRSAGRDRPLQTFVGQAPPPVAIFPFTISNYCVTFSRGLLEGAPRTHMRSGASLLAAGRFTPGTTPIPADSTYANRISNRRGAIRITPNSSPCTTNSFLIVTNGAFFRTSANPLLHTERSTPAGSWDRHSCLWASGAGQPPRRSPSLALPHKKIPNPGSKACATPPICLALPCRERRASSPTLIIWYGFTARFEQRAQRNPRARNLTT
jgi:hypothetical protein